MTSVKLKIAEPIYVPTVWLGGSETETAQVFPVLFTSDLSPVRKHFVVCAYAPLMDQAQRESVAAHLCQRGAGVTCSFIVRDAEGEAQVISGIGGVDAPAYEVAAAVAVMKASCGWDESQPIMVRVNNIEVSVDARFDGREWVASFPPVS